MEKLTFEVTVATQEERANLKQFCIENELHSEVIDGVTRNVSVPDDFADTFTDVMEQLKLPYRLI